MDLMSLVMIAVQVSIISTVFGFGLKTTLHDVLYVVRQPALLLRSLLAVFVVMPVFAIVLVQLFAFRPNVEVALIALAISPVPPLLPMKEAHSGGDSSYALGLMAILAVLAVVVIPLHLEILERVFGRPLTIAPGVVARTVLVGALVPLSAGVLVRATMPRVGRGLEKPLAVLVMILLPLAVIVLLVGAAPGMWAVIGDGTLAALALFVAVGLLVGHVLGGPDAGHSLVLAVSTACRHPAIALSIVTANFPEQRVGAAILLYVLVGAAGCVPYFAWQRRQAISA